MVKLGEVCTFIRGVTYEKTDESSVPTTVAVLRANNIDLASHALNLTDIKYLRNGVNLPPEKILKKGDIFICTASGSKEHLGKVAFVSKDSTFYFGGFMGCVRCSSAALSQFVFHTMTSSSYDDFIRGLTAGANINNLKGLDLLSFEIPLPPLDEQERIVAELEAYRKVIEGARAVLDHYRPHIPIHPDWPTPSFVDAPFEIIDGDRGVNYPKKEDFLPSGYCVFLNTKNVRSDGFNFSELDFVSKEKDEALRKGKLRRGDVVLTTRGTIGNTGFFDESVEFDHIRLNSGMLIFRPDTTKLSGSYLFHFFQSQNFQAQRDAIVSGAAQPQLPIRSLNEAKIPLPPLSVQREIVAELDSERKLVDANRDLIARMEAKIQAKLAEVWGEEGSDD